jgi:hypothetical protein
MKPFDQVSTEAWLKIGCDIPNMALSGHPALSLPGPTGQHPDLWQPPGDCGEPLRYCAIIVRV